ncbi:MAG: hypothetical protein ACYTHJ_06800 [Planctomycetota bacterium]
MPRTESTTSAPRGIRPRIAQLQAIRGSFDEVATRDKLSILDSLDDCVIRGPHLLIDLHRELCYLRAFPDSAAVYQRAGGQLARFRDRLRSVSRSRRHLLNNSGIEGSRIYYEFSYYQAHRLALSFPQQVCIDWKTFEHEAALDDLLTHVIEDTEEDAFESGEISTREWMRNASGNGSVNDLTWLMRQITGHSFGARLWAHLYDGAEVPLRWNLVDQHASITCNAVERRITFRQSGMRKPPGQIAKAITERMTGIQRVPPKQAAELITAAMNALAVRLREVFSMDHANVHETYRIPTGCGTEAVLFGVKMHSRPTLESNYGYMLMSNGVPIGYGGVSPLFHQANTGINLFEEYRRSEAAYLFVQLLRGFHTLFGTRQFLVNPYQLGSDNTEAINSGALWFYYRLGFRPVRPEVRKLALEEWSRLKKNRRHRSKPETLRTLSRSDFVLRLPGSRQSEFFAEDHLCGCSRGATRLINSIGAPTGSEATRILSRRALALLGTDDASWTREERTAFRRMSPLVLLVEDLARWPRTVKTSLAALMRSQGRTATREYVNRLRTHERLRTGLVDYCRKNRRPS